jgi:hypothetical protein
MKQINSTTYTTPELGDVKPVVTIGGDDTRKFIPNVNNSFHDDEFFFNLNCVDDWVTDELATKLDGVISQTISNETHEYYIDDSGRLKWDKIFSSCPDSMRARFKVRKSAGVQFYYQGELTAEEIADGCERPDDIIGSYAVYCDKANNNYKTGKLCHIPRPFVIDASGNREWCVMTYEEISDTEGMLYIDMPESFMRNADYSLGDVRLDPTIGYTTAGASSAATDRYLESINDSVTMPANGTASKVYAYMRGSGADHSALLGFYNASAGVPNALVDGNKSVTVNSATPEWYSADVSGGLTGAAVYYPTAITNPSAGGYNYLYYDTGSGVKSYYRTGQSTMPSTYGTAAESTRKRSIYLEYAESGGATGNSYYYQQQQM